VKNSCKLKNIVICTLLVFAVLRVVTIFFFVVNMHEESCSENSKGKVVLLHTAACHEGIQWNGNVGSLLS
jgi:flagellar basal body-associated protein FliL